MTAEPLYRSHPGPQDAMMLSDAEELLYGGAKGGGKSHALRAFGVDYCLRYPGAAIALFRRSYRELEDTHIMAIQNEVPSTVAEYKVGQHNLVFPSGSVLMFRFCFHPKTEILTEGGWVPIAEAHPGLRVATLAPTYEIEFHAVREAVVVDAPQMAYVVGGRSYGKDWFAATPDHEVLIERNGHWEKRRLADIPQCRLVRRGKPVQRADIGPVSLPDGRSIDAADALAFVGWFVSEGCMSTQNRAFISQKKPEGIRTLDALLPRVLRYYSRTLRRDDRATVIYHFHRAEVESLVAAAKAREKRLPRWVYAASARQLTILLDALIAGDGHIRPGPKAPMTYSTRSRGLADDVQELAALLGIVATIHPNPKSGDYCVYLSPRRQSYGSMVRPSSVRTEPYGGKAYCVNVPPNHTVLTRYNGRVMWSGNCEEDDNVYSYDTTEWDALLIDELTQFTEFSYIYLTTRVRSTKLWWPGPRIRCATTPLRRGHAWCKRRWVDSAAPYEIKKAPPEEGGMTRQFIPATALDNVTLMAQDAKYVDRLKILPDAEYRAAMGDWEVTTSQYFNRWRTSVHVCATFDIPPEWTRYMVVDYGYAKPYAVLWAARPPNTNFLWFYREHYGAGVSAPEQVRRAREAISPDEKIQFCVLDPSMFSKRPEEGSPISDDWKELGIDLIRGNNERIPGWTVMRECLDWTEGPGGQVVVIPRMHVMESCPNLIRTLPQLQMDKNNPEDADSEGEDHTEDAARYLLRHLFGAPVRPPPAQYVNGPKGLMVLPARQRARKLVGV